MCAKPSIQHHVFWLPKSGNAVEEYEDAYCGDTERGRFAIADGASESSYAAQWAKLLVEAFVESTVSQPWPWTDWLPSIQQRWQKEVDALELPWFAEAKVKQGAFATFLGLVVETKAGFFGTKKRWQAVAVGDSCLFQVRADKLRQAFPIEQSKAFGNSPWLVGSRHNTESPVEKKTVRGRGNLREGDRLWLMTDALAQWFLVEVEAGHKPWDAMNLLLTDVQPELRFASWIGEMRDASVLRNDDVTLEVIVL